jgi:large conductance mechanosensitive channel
MLKDFKKFILRGSFVDLAIGFTVGAAFSTVAKSLVNDIIMPPISYLLGGGDIANYFFVLKQGTTPPPYNTLDSAQKAGAITLNYGQFFNNILTLILVGIAMFLVVKAMSNLENQFVLISGKKEKEKPSEPTDKKCPFCFSTIPFKATRCPNCTSQLKK